VALLLLFIAARIAPRRRFVVTVPLILCVICARSLLAGVAIPAGLVLLARYL
jgi:hypothetical protein